MITHGPAVWMQMEYELHNLAGPLGGFLCSTGSCWFLLACWLRTVNEEPNCSVGIFPYFLSIGYIPSGAIRLVPL
ncbi:hypothetical protein BGZ63DRAFT_46772 [Mariannaea sp. PMI_226]|nr:hypothetical protein BGZ63DRAFT_46772 [Mariannaea sp. PMI_226]